MFCPVSRLVVPGSTGPPPEQKVYVCVPFFFLWFVTQGKTKGQQLKGKIVS